ncbi:right-handed parallel beta-helix repeat-containing protein [Paenibacillus sp. GCM10027627]
MKKWIWSLVIGLQLSLLPQPLTGAAELESFNIEAENRILAAAAPTAEAASQPTGAASIGEVQPHLIDLKRWGISSNGTKPVETTKGINNALKWASNSGIKAVTLPKGTYLIDKNSRINMVSHMLFQLPDGAVIQKESNGKELYHTLYVGFGVEQVTIKGGAYKGDRNGHNFDQKDNVHSSGTHEGGFGIALEGANSVTIDGVSSTDFTGDGLIIGGHGSLIMDLYEKSFVSGEFDEKGKAIASKNKIRTQKPLNLNHPLFKVKKEFELSNAMKLPLKYDLYFFDKSNKLVGTLKDKKMRESIQIPAQATSVHFVFHKADSKGAYVEMWSRTVSSNVVVKNSEFAYNRRQGITVGGADQVLIEGNELHHMKGTLPQAGIDVEGGYHYNGHFNSNITIKNNKFHNNASYDVVLYDGINAVVEGNHLASKDVIGLAISEPFDGATIRNNHFDGSRIMAYNNATFTDNRMDRSLASFLGTKIKIDGMELTDSILSITSKEAFGNTVSNVKITSLDNKRESGLSLWGKRIRLSDITIVGESALRTFTGGVEPGSIIDRLKVIGYNSKLGLSLPPATYNNCEFSGAEGGAHGSVNLGMGGKYEFNSCTFTASSTASASLTGEHAGLDLTIKNSTFELLGNNQAISIQKASSVLLENNRITARKLTSEKTEIIRFNDYWKRSENHDILKATVTGNTIVSNVAAVGISTVYAGVGAPSYLIENNVLEKAKLALKANDKNVNNVLK